MIYIGLFVIALIVMTYGGVSYQRRRKRGGHVARCHTAPLEEGYSLGVPPSKVTAYNFNTTWCGWSKRLQPTWERIMAKYRGSDIEVIDVKCDGSTEEQNKCREAGVQGFPTILLARPDGATFEYHGDRSFDDIDSWIKVSASAPALH